MLPFRSRLGPSYCPAKALFWRAKGDFSIPLMSLRKHAPSIPSDRIGKMLREVADDDQVISPALAALTQAEVLKRLEAAFETTPGGAGRHEAGSAPGRARQTALTLEALVSILYSLDSMGVLSRKLVVAILRIFQRNPENNPKKNFQLTCVLLSLSSKNLMLESTFHSFFLVQEGIFLRHLQQATLDEAGTFLHSLGRFCHRYGWKPCFQQSMLTVAGALRRGGGGSQMQKGGPSLSLWGAYGLFRVQEAREALRGQRGRDEGELEVDFDGMSKTLLQEVSLCPGLLCSLSPSELVNACQVGYLGNSLDISEKAAEFLVLQGQVQQLDRHTSSLLLDAASGALEKRLKEGPLPTARFENVFWLLKCFSEASGMLSRETLMMSGPQLVRGVENAHRFGQAKLVLGRDSDFTDFLREKSLFEPRKAGKRSEMEEQVLRFEEALCRGVLAASRKLSRSTLEGLMGKMETFGGGQGVLPDLNRVLQEKPKADPSRNQQRRRETAEEAEGGGGRELQVWGGDGSAQG